MLLLPMNLFGLLGECVCLLYVVYISQGDTWQFLGMMYVASHSIHDPKTTKQNWIGL